MNPSSRFVFGANSGLEALREDGEHLFSPVQSVLTAVAENAARMSDATNAEIFRLEDNLLRVAASYGELPVVIGAHQGIPVDRDTVAGRAACDRRTIHVHDLNAEESMYPVGSSAAKVAGFRTTLATPLLREGILIGMILVRRREVRPFSDGQIALVETFADLAVIAIENARLLEAEKRRALALAHAYRDLAEREAKIRRLVDSNIIGIFLWNFEGRILEANDEFLRMVGYDREDLLSGSMRWTDLTPPDWRDSSNARMEQGKSSGRFEPFEKEYTRKYGGRVSVLIGGALFEQGGNEGVAFVLDLTVRKRAEEALMRSEAYLAEAQKLTHTGSWAWNPQNGEVLYCSEEMFQIFGLDRRVSSPSRENFRQQIHPEDRDRIKEKFEEALRKKVDTRDDYRVLLRDGTVKQISASGHLVLNGEGDVIEFVGTAIDVTEHKRAEEAMRESELKLREIVETMPAMTWSTAPDGEPTRVNQRVLDYAGMRFENFLNLGWKEFLHPEDFPETARAFYRALQTGEPYEAVHRLRRADGQYRWHHALGVPLRDKEQRIIQWYGLTVDIDERKRAEEQLRCSESYLAETQLALAHANRVATMGQLTASIAHEVNQPIGSARNNARAALNFLDRSHPDLDEVREALGCIVADADRAGGIIDRIRDQIKKVPPRSDRFDLNRAIEEVIGLAQSMMTENGVSVKSRLASGMAPVLGDRVQLQQVILNLILNAVEAMSSVEAEERQLFITTDQSEANGTLVAVRDSGPGIDPKHLEHVFEAFYSTKSGMGMGLSICRSIITAHGGQLWAAATEPRGALFQFMLPGAKSSIAGPVTTRESRKKTLL